MSVIILFQHLYLFFNYPYQSHISFVFFQSTFFTRAFKQVTIPELFVVELTLAVTLPIKQIKVISIRLLSLPLLLYAIERVI